MSPPPVNDDRAQPYDLRDFGRRLVCPACKGDLSVAAAGPTCMRCSVEYGVVEGIPLFLPQALTEQQLGQTAYFDTEFKTYAECRPENWRLSFVRRIFDSLEIPEAGGPYLDVGVGGSGATVIEAARVGIDATGCDLSVEGVRQAARFAREQGVALRASFVACAAEALPFPDDEFQSASAVAVLEHLDDDLAAINELARVIRPNGLLWITVPNAYRYIPPPLWPVYLIHDRKLGHKRHYDAATLTRRVSGSGFHHVSTLFSGHPVKVLQLAVDRLLPLSDRRRSRIWWNLEGRDLRAHKRALGALQLNAVFRKKP